MKAAVVFSLLLTLFAGQAPCDAQNGNPVVVMETTKGPIVIAVFQNMVPNTAWNFLDLVGRGFYNGLSFHRVESWCIQGGDPNGNGSGSFIDPQTGQPRYLRLEINRNLGHRRAGVVAMARSKNPNSASCQFYITKAPMPGLDGQYAVFGGVVDGMNTVMNIRPGDRILSARIVSRNSGTGGGGMSTGTPTTGGGSSDAGQQGSSTNSGF